MDIIDALGTLRDLRNDKQHHSNKEDLLWEQLALPLRVVLDAAVFLASYPILSRPSPAPDGRWRFTVLKGEILPFPEAEWTLAAGVLGESGHFTPKRDDLTLYQLWPCPDGTLGLLKLWPFAEQRLSPEEGRTVWLLYGPDGRNPKRLWERSALNGQESCSADVLPERMQALAKLGAI